MYMPLFPLELVVFPGEELRLHIFEPRYKQLIHECSETGATFGIPAFHKGKLALYGTEMELSSIETRYPTGEMDVVTRGLRVFHIDSFIQEVPDKLYSAGEVTPVTNVSEGPAEVTGELVARYARLHEALKTGRGANTFTAESMDNLSYRVAQEVGLSLEQKMLLLSMSRESDREQLLIEHLRGIVPMVEAAEETKAKIAGNGHFLKPKKLDL